MFVKPRIGAEIFLMIGDIKGTVSRDGFFVGIKFNQYVLGMR
jgi:hypothetical protein